ncbi:transcriptional regulator, AraC family with amidase-like domain [Streptomyces zhaozhouensis]|uniref:Transcriptional regulator, AraC family with amidase-like domain n=1 Tax=Streptomyces zhaozhouensis TaxID=1300267 RepID=A0A286DXX2_9ACTN|nr:helix-turn-helix domain-containing protein [Streptomyces zhaozhouensis]SOD63518.1 transcriptional regulator, AraC family with amidase-like domain [Streptomyces zhaozhouensis]
MTSTPPGSSPPSSAPRPAPTSAGGGAPGSAERAGRRHVVALVVTDRTPDFELAVPCEVFGLDRSDLVDPWYELRLCAGEPGELRTASGLVVPTTHGLDALAEADTVMVAACARSRQLVPPPELISAVREAHRRGRRVVSLCAGAYVLAEAGLLDGRRATTHWMNATDFAHRYPTVDFDPEPLYIDTGSILTSAGTGSVIDLCLHLVRRDLGAAVANEVARRMVVPPHREGGQTQFAKPLARSSGRGGDGLAPVLDWARERLDQPLTVPGLAREAGLSERTFARRFRDTLGTTPLRWLLQERVRLAQELLETTDEPVETIAHRAGFGTAANLRHHFRRTTTVSPATYRHVFRHRSAGVRAKAPTRPPERPGLSPGSAAGTAPLAHPAPQPPEQSPPVHPHALTPLSDPTLHGE